MLPRTRTALAALPLTLAVAPALAQLGPKAEISKQGLIDGVDFSLRANGEITLQADLRDSPGSVAVYRAGANLGLFTSVGEDWRIGMEVAWETSWYNFRGATTIIPGTDRPFHEMHQVRLAPTASHQLSTEWSYFFGGLFEFGAERDADFGDSFTGGGLIGARYAVSETFAFSFGILAKTRLEKNALFAPILGLEWQINDNVRLATRGLGGAITYTINDRWSFEAFGEYEAREYRLDDTGPNIDGVVRDRRAPVGIGFTWRPTGQTELNLRGGAIVYQQFRTDTSTGLNITEVRTEPTGFVSFGGSIRF
ncbi:MAG: DUF6268 family outer membrane beta-barrel protein [Phycisphaerales bacterium]